MYFIFEENGPENTFEAYNIKNSVLLNPLIQHLETQLEIFHAVWLNVILNKFQLKWGKLEVQPGLCHSVTSGSL